jgi:radical SAM superfamily enzyme YgiQ (UPF0313 family)
MRQILLINAKTRNPFWRPVGLEYVAEALAEAGYGVHLLDLTLEDEPARAVRERLASDNYDALGISIFNTQWDTGRDRVYFCLPDVRSLIADIRKMTRAPVVLGGYGYSMQPEHILEYVGGDYGVAGCGVQALPDLLERIARNAVEQGTVVSDQSGKYLDMDFKRNTVDGDRYPENETVYVGAHDGCTSSCYHCPFGNSEVRFRSREPARVIAEARNLVRQGITRIALGSDMINASVAYAESLCEGLAGVPVEWSTDVYPVGRCLPVGLVDLMARSGMFAANIGSRITGSDRMRGVYGQEFDSGDIERATKLFRERGVRTSWFIGLGAPGESRETLAETFALIDRAEPDTASIITRARIYRNAKLFDIARREGLLSPDDRLLEPAYYPFADELRDYIWEEAERRENCTVYY